MQDYDSEDSDLVIPVTKKTKREIKDLKSIIQLNSNAKRRRENYKNLTCKLSQKSQEKDFETSAFKLENVQHPEFIDLSLLKEYFTTNVILAMLKTGRITDLKQIADWTLNVALHYSKETWNFKVLQVFKEILNIQGDDCKMLVQRSWELVLQVLKSRESHLVKTALEISLILELSLIDSDVDWKTLDRFLEICMDEWILSNYFLLVSRVLGHWIGRIYKDYKENVVDWIIIKEPKRILKFLIYLEHSQKTLVQEISQEFLCKVYKKNSKDYLQLLLLEENILEDQENFEKDFLVIYLVKSSLEIQDLSLKEKGEWLLWIKKKSRMKTILTAEYISVLNFLNVWRFMF